MSEPKAQDDLDGAMPPALSRSPVVDDSTGAPRSGAALEANSLARELARGYAELVASYQRGWGISAAEAETKLREQGDWALVAVERDPAPQLSWHTLSSAMARDPDAALAAWERVKTAARDELRSGHRTAQALEWRGTPWERARFLALRDAFHSDWRPRGAIEASLVELLAQSFSEHLVWTERLSMYAETQCQLEDVKLKQEGYWMPPRLGEARWLDWCAGQAAAAHRRFLMTLKMLHDLRRLPAVSIAAAGQVSIGGVAQQVNIMQADERGEPG